MKKIIALVLALTISLCFCACGSGSGSDSGDGSVTTNGTITIDGICVDDSYVDDDNSSLKMVYVFFTVTPGDTNMKVDSAYNDMKIGENTYTSETYSDVNDYAPNYYFSNYIEEVYVGDSLKVCLTYKVPEGDLAAGKEITFSDSQISDFSGIKLLTDNIKHYNSDQEVAQAMDPDGYAEISEKHEPADDATVSQVKSSLNGYYWTFYCNYTSYKIEFYADANWTLTAGGNTTSGSYQVLKGYVALHYDSNGIDVYIPWTMEDDGLHLDCVEAYDVLD